MTVNVFDNLDCNNENSLFIEPVVEEDLTNTVEMYTKKEMLILLIYNYGNCCNSHSCNNQTSHIYLWQCTIVVHLFLAYNWIIRATVQRHDTAHKAVIVSGSSLHGANQEFRYDMLMASIVDGVHVNIPVVALKSAPGGSSVPRLSVTTSPSLSYVVTLSVISRPIVTFTTESTAMFGLLLAEIVYR